MVGLKPLFTCLFQEEFNQRYINQTFLQWNDFDLYLNNRGKWIAKVAKINFGNIAKMNN